MKLLVLAVCLGIALSNPSQTVQIGTSGSTAQFNQSGFQISTNGNWMSLQWATIQEVDASGNVLQTVDLSKHHFGWSAPVDLTVPLVNGYSSTDHFPAVNFNETLENGAWFNITAWLVNTDASNSDAKHGDVKWSMAISHWPWTVPGSGKNGCQGENCGTVTGNSLIVTAGLVGFGGIVRSTTNRAIKGPAIAGVTYMLQNVEYQSGFLWSPVTANYDSGNIRSDVVVGHTVKGKPIATWQFSYFQNSVVYDPNIANTGAAGGTTGGGNSGANGNTKNPGTVQTSVGSAQFNKNDGSFGISTNGNWMGLQWATLSEIATDGTVLQSLDLSKHHFGWSTPDVYTVFDNLQYSLPEKMPHVNFTASLENGCTFTVDAWIYTDNSQVNSCKRGDVKFTITIQNWVWAGGAGACTPGQCEGCTGTCTGGQLVLTAGLVGYGGIIRSTDRSGKGTNATIVENDFVYGVLYSPSQANYDGTWYPATVSHTLSGKPEVSWTFSYFQNYVIYDPTASSTPSSPETVNFATSPGMISLYAILGILTIGILAFLVVYTIRNTKKRRESTFEPQSSTSNVAMV